MARKAERRRCGGGSRRPARLDGGAGLGDGPARLRSEGPLHRTRGPRGVRARRERRRCDGCRDIVLEVIQGRREPRGLVARLDGRAHVAGDADDAGDGTAGIAHRQLPRETPPGLCGMVRRGSRSSKSGRPALDTASSFAEGPRPKPPGRLSQGRRPSTRDLWRSPCRSTSEVCPRASDQRRPRPRRRYPPSGRKVSQQRSVNRGRGSRQRCGGMPGCARFHVGARFLAKTADKATN